MKSVPFEFNGVTYALSFTAEALFKVYEKYGTGADILESTHFMEDTLEGLRSACWLGALLASQGELQNRHMGRDPQPMLSAEELRRFISPIEMRELRAAINRALIQGLRRENLPDEDQEVDAVLAERSALAKKTKALAASVLAGWRLARQFFTSR